MAEGRSCSFSLKVLLFGFVLVISLASVVTFSKKERQCTVLSSSTCLSSLTSGVEDDAKNLITEGKDEVQKYEHIRVLILSSMASKLQGIRTDVVEMTNEHPVSFAVSQPEHCLVSPTATAELLGTYVVILHLFIIIVALAFDQMISRYYKKVSKDSAERKVEPSPSPHELGNLDCSTPKREVTEVQRYPFPIGIRNLPLVMPSRSKRVCFRWSRSRGLQFLKPERDCQAQRRLQILKQQILLCH